MDSETLHAHMMQIRFMIKVKYENLAPPQRKMYVKLFGEGEVIIDNLDLSPVVFLTGTKLPSFCWEGVW